MRDCLRNWWNVDVGRNSLMWFRGFLCRVSRLLTWTSKAECLAVFVFPLNGNFNPRGMEGFPPNACVYSSSLSGFKCLLLRGQSILSCPQLGLGKVPNRHLEMSPNQGETVFCSRIRRFILRGWVPFRKRSLQSLTSNGSLLGPWGEQLDRVIRLHCGEREHEGS